jgi:TolB protein
MRDAQDILDEAARATESLVLPEDRYGRLLDRRDRKRRNKRIGAAIVAIVIAVIGLAGLVGSLRQRGSSPATRAPIPTLNGQIVFVVKADALNDALYTVRPDGSHPTQIASVHAEYPDWSPDGSTVAFDDGRTVDHPDWSKNEGHIFIVKADGTGLTQLTRGAGSEFTPAWSPDGRHIAVTAEGEGTRPPGIFVLDVSTGRIRAITSNPFGHQDKGPDYSPDGTQIAFVRDRALVDTRDLRNLSALFVVNADGSGLRRLTPWRIFAGTPSWSPDGSTIVFRSFETNGQIFKIGSNGKGLIQLTNEPTAVSFWPSWSPDGTRIVFSRGIPGQGYPEPYTMWPDGSHVAPLLSGGQTNGNQADWGTHP